MSQSGHSDAFWCGFLKKLLRKPDVTKEQMLDWAEYLGKPPDKACASIYAQAAGYSNSVRAWYWRSIRSKRRTSLVVRGVTFAMLVVGTVLPILAALHEDVLLRLQFTQLGVGTLVIGGLLQLADRVFGWSSGWLRYVTTVTALENLTRGFELDWARYVLGRGDGLESSDVLRMFELARSFQDKVAKAQCEETEKWVTEFNTSIALLGDLIKSQREVGEKAIEATRNAVAAESAREQADEASRMSGAIEVTLVHNGGVLPVTIGLDDETGVTFCGGMWTRKSVAPGQHTVRVRTRSNPPQAIEKIAQVPPGGIESVSIPLP